MNEPIDLAALGRAQTRGEDIRPQRPEPEPVEEPAGREVTVGQFLETCAILSAAWELGLRRELGGRP